MNDSSQGASGDVDLDKLQSDPAFMKEQEEKLKFYSLEFGVLLCLLTNCYLCFTTKDARGEVSHVVLIQ